MTALALVFYLSSLTTQDSEREVEGVGAMKKHRQGKEVEGKNKQQGGKMINVDAKERTGERR